MHMRPPQCLNPPVRQPHRGWRGYSSFDQPPSSFLQQIQPASIAAHVAVRFKQLAMLSRKDRCGITARKGVK